MAIDYSKFDKMIDIEGLKADYKDAEENGGGNYREVPHGTYEVSVNKMELTESKKGDPMVSIWFNILSGEYKGSFIFYNQVVTQGFQIHTANELLRSMDTDVEITFENYTQYAQMLLDVAEACDNTLEFVLNYGENKKGYNTFEITEVFEVE